MEKHERGVVGMYAARLKSFAEALDVPISYFFTGEDPDLDPGIARLYLPSPGVYEGPVAMIPAGCLVHA